MTHGSTLSSSDITVDERYRQNRSWTPISAKGYSTTTATTETFPADEPIPSGRTYSAQNWPWTNTRSGSVGGKVSLSVSITKGGEDVASVVEQHKRHISNVIFGAKTYTGSLLLPQDNNYFVSLSAGIIGKLQVGVVGIGATSVPFIRMENLIHRQATTDYNLFPSDPVTRQIAALRDLTSISFASNLATRIEELRAYQMEDDSIDVDRTSLSAFVGIVASGKISTAPAISLDPDGRLIARWKEDKDHVVIVRLIDETTAHFALFVPDEKHRSRTVRISGEAPVDSVLDEIALHGYRPWQ